MIDYVFHVGNLDIDCDERIPAYHTGRKGLLRTERAAELYEKVQHLRRVANLGHVVLYKLPHPKGFEYHCRAVKGM